MTSSAIQPRAGTSIAGTLVQRANLAASDRAAMFDLLSAHFSGVERDQFESDLDQKNWALLLHDDTGRLAGFSTMLVYETTFDGRAISVVCSGDTIVHQSAWSSAALPREWIAAVNRLRDLFPRGAYYWLLLTSGFRTYRLLSTFWQSFWPRHDSATPEIEQRLIDALAGGWFGDEYDAARGIVRFARPQVLRPPLAGVPVERLADPHVAWFVSRNPGHERGDELVCLCELAESNLTRAGARVVYGPRGLRP